jgi:hypothetical protein
MYDHQNDVMTVLFWNIILMSIRHMKIYLACTAETWSQLLKYTSSNILIWKKPTHIKNWQEISCIEFERLYSYAWSQTWRPSHYRDVNVGFKRSVSKYLCNNFDQHPPWSDWNSKMGPIWLRSNKSIAYELF